MKHNEPVIIRVGFDMDGGFGGRWNIDLAHPAYHDFVPVLPARALDDAVFALRHLHDMRPLVRAREQREARNRVIEAHFAECARQLIDQIEAKEGWGKLV
jgi:hypothetical protein